MNWDANGFARLGPFALSAYAFDGRWAWSVGWRYGTCAQGDAETEDAARRRAAWAAKDEAARVTKEVRGWRKW